MSLNSIPLNNNGHSSFETRSNKSFSTDDKSRLATSSGNLGKNFKFSGGLLKLLIVINNSDKRDGMDSLSLIAKNTLKFLLPRSLVFELLNKMQGTGGFEFKIPLLPNKIQLYLTGSPILSYLQSNNAVEICKSLLKGDVHSNVQVL